MSDPSTVSASQENSSEKGITRVMVVDDSKNSAEILAMFFEMEGMQTAVAFDGLEALETAESFRPHIVFMDLTMPKMDGFEAARRLKTTMESVVLVALTGWESEEDRHKSAAAGFHHHVIKPVKPDDLRLLIAKYA